MTENCQWLGSKLDDYFEEKLISAELQRFEAHRAACPDCQSRVAEMDSGLTTAEPVLRQVLLYRMAQSRRAVSWNSGPRVWKLALAGSGLVVVGFLSASLFFRAPASTPGPIAIQPPAVQEPAPVTLVKTEKIEEKETTGGVERAKPDAGVAPAPTLRNSSATAAEGAEFAIIDDAGYAASLETYRGKVFLFAVVSPESKDAVRNLQGLYAAFGANPGVRILGVSTRRDARLTGFPVFYNHGSKLLGVETGQYFLADTSGKAVLRGPLTEAGAARVRAQLGQLGIQ